MRTACLILTILLPGLLPAQGLIRNFGAERSGTTVLNFLKIGVGARAEGMAQAFVGVADDATALYWNPAGLGLLKGSQLSINHLEWPTDITYDYLGGVHRLTDRHSLGLAYSQLRTDPMPVTTEERPQGDGTTFYFMDQCLQLTGAMRMTNQFSCGLSLKYVREDIAEVRMDGWLMDLGTFYRTGWRDFSIAVSLSNFGGVFRPQGDYLPANSEDGRRRSWEDFSPPTVFRIGSALHVLDLKEHRVLLAGQINHPVDNLENYLFGLEYCWLGSYFARAGWKFNAGEESWTAGAGVSYKLGALGIKLDISYSDFGLLYNSRRMSSQFSWEDER